MPLQRSSHASERPEQQREDEALAVRRQDSRAGDRAIRGAAAPAARSPRRRAGAPPARPARAVARGSRTRAARHPSGRSSMRASESSEAWSARLTVSCSTSTRSRLCSTACARRRDRGERRVDASEQGGRRVGLQCGLRGMRSTTRPARRASPDPIRVAAPGRRGCRRGDRSRRAAHSRRLRANRAPLRRGTPSSRRPVSSQSWAARRLTSATSASRAANDVGVGDGLGHAAQLIRHLLGLGPDLR